MQRSVLLFVKILISHESPELLNRAMGSSNSDSSQEVDDSSQKLLATSVLIVVILGALLGGLAYVVRSLKNVELTLLLNLRRDDKAEKKY